MLPAQLLLGRFPLASSSLQPANCKVLLSRVVVVDLFAVVEEQVSIVTLLQVLKVFQHWFVKRSLGGYL